MYDDILALGATIKVHDERLNRIKIIFKESYTRLSPQQREMPASHVGVLGTSSGISCRNSWNILFSHLYVGLGQLKAILKQFPTIRYQTQY